MSMTFGKYAINEAITHYFRQEPTWWWRILPITAAAELELQKFSVVNRVVTDAAGTRHEFPPTYIETAMHEIAATFGGTNITFEDTQAPGGKVPVLKENASIGEIEAVLVQMPPEMVEELWSAVGEANPTWGPPRTRLAVPSTVKETETVL